ncbi:13952_t:CDS:10, partial [Acaulospora colombiana]
MASPASILSDRSLAYQSGRASNDIIASRGNSVRPQSKAPPKTPTNNPQYAPSILPEEERKPRMVINKMVLVNFKSYFGRQEIGPFHKACSGNYSFSSVVGPNGSGKSNVIDALLFVFGYRANKMRQGKLSELIHSSQGYETLDHCVVEVHFQEIHDLPGQDDFEVVPHSELVISRQAFRNNSSKYFINGRSSNYTEVTSLLKKRGIDLDHKRFLILQGEVESISQMKPKAPNEHEDGLLEYLEDIIGTSKYKEPIEKSSQKVEQYNEERSEKLHRGRSLTLRIKKAKKKEAEEFLREENKLSVKKSTLYQRHLFDLKNIIDINIRMVDQLNNELRTEQEKHAQTHQEYENLENSYANSLKEYAALEKETDLILKEKSKYDREVIHLEEKKKHAQTKQKKLLKTMQNERHALSEARTSIRYNEDDLNKRKQEIERLEASLGVEEQALEAIRESLKGKFIGFTNEIFVSVNPSAYQMDDEPFNNLGKTEGFTAKIEEKQRELSPWIEKINSKQSAIDVTQSEYNILNDKVNSLRHNLEQAEKDVVSLGEARRSKEQEIEASRHQINMVKKEIEKIEVTLKNSNDIQEKIRTCLSDARQKENEAKTLLQSSQSRGQVLTSLLKLRDSGRIKGLYDRLGNLGVIDDKYDVAISTACPALDHIVVESVEDMGSITTPEGVPRLFDLVKPKDGKFAPAFYKVLQNTLVAKDLQQATRIAYGKQRWRVVTLEGQLFDLVGTMSGGGHRVIRGGMSSKLVSDVTPEMISALEKERNRLEDQWKEFNEQRKTYESRLQQLKSELPKMELNISKLEMDSSSCAKRIADTQKLVSELRQQNKPNVEDRKRMQQLKDEIEKLNRELNKLKNHSSKIEDEIGILHEKILQVGGDKLRAQKLKVDSIKEQMDMINDRITTAQVAKSKAEKDVTKFENSISKNEREIEQLNLEMQELEGNIRQNTEASRSIAFKAEEAKKARGINIADKKEVLDVIKAERDEKATIINHTRAIQLEIKNKLENNERILSENRHKENHLVNSLQKLTLHEISDDEQPPEFPTFSDDELKAIDVETLQNEIEVLNEKIQNANPNLNVLTEYKRCEEEYLSRAKDLEEITRMRDGCKKEYDDLRKLRLEEFMHGFTLISQKLKEMYQMITLGGNAELECCDSLDPFSEGIIFSVMPPKKSWKNISNLSGGEKTLSSLALVFALHHFKPTPLYVMDEIDAALDFRNVSIVANYIKERTKNAQFIVISLRNNMFELADRLVGIYKTNNM